MLVQSQPETSALVMMENVWQAEWHASKMLRVDDLQHDHFDFLLVFGSLLASGFVHASLVLGHEPLRRC